MRWGIRALVGVSFAEIFYGNCLALGVPCAAASSQQISVLQDAVDADPALNWQLDLSGLTFHGAVSEPIQVAAGALDMPAVPVGCHRPAGGS